jgi:hypothetical protein
LGGCAGRRAPRIRLGTRRRRCGDVTRAALAAQRELRVDRIVKLRYPLVGLICLGKASMMDGRPIGRPL